MTRCSLLSAVMICVSLCALSETSQAEDILQAGGIATASNVPDDGVVQVSYGFNPIPKHSFGNVAPAMQPHYGKHIVLKDDPFTHPASPIPPQIPYGPYKGATWDNGPGQVFGNSWDPQGAWPGHCPGANSCPEIVPMEYINKNAPQHQWQAKPLFRLSGYHFIKPKGVWGRLEYLHWSMTDPGDVYIGEPYLASAGGTAIVPPTDLTDLDTTTDANDGGFTSSQGIGFDWSSVQLKDTNGIRATVGMPTNMGAAVEWSIFGLDQRGMQFSRTTPPAVILPTLANNELLDGFLIFNQGANFSYTSDVWGTDVTFVIDSLKPPGEGFHIYPLAGFAVRQLDFNLNEEFVSFDPTTTTYTRSRIGASAKNVLWGPTMGVRMELEHRWFHLGVEPALFFGFNSSGEEVNATNVLGFDDTNVRSDFNFSPSLELNCYGRFKVKEYMWLTVGYDLMRILRVVRPENDFDYNVTTTSGTQTTIANINAGTDPVTGVDVAPIHDADPFTISGLSVGLQIGPY
ncbi:BBP7 family outer membrane beta-barrel protein [Calycomorphotria hydatis]|uniref:Outer membrane protein transport protein (OMPP1/FadL/TodX) n=1 Tax=Calycomorphotria hydatis TaxID=2528027 RepID=A0A517T4W8_9PLAN|nr:BBP7 family outer membrane beta-barrel protein [Calycomorphotria hydatis]QDT63410.1 hypothetical protein V22_06310 [Calycomorphotria hydatis]